MAREPRFGRVRVTRVSLSRRSSALGSRLLAVSFDDLVGAGEYRLRNG
jgi:hypothetical protein